MNYSNFNTKCPDFEQYKSYLNNTGSPEFANAFNKHINECALCSEAIEGLKSTSINETTQSLNKVKMQFFNKKQKHYLNYRLLTYAATILIIAGLFSIGIYSKNKIPAYEQSAMFDYSLLQQENTQGLKTIKNKSSEQFIYISNCKTISYNDQIINREQLTNLPQLSNASIIRIEVSGNNYECATKIINKLKNTYNTPVLTIKEKSTF